jgi:hypothetical protein
MLVLSTNRFAMMTKLEVDIGGRGIEWRVLRPSHLNEALMVKIDAQGASELPRQQSKIGTGIDER